jgi:hypothetical protein
MHKPKSPQGSRTNLPLPNKAYASNPQDPSLPRPNLHPVNAQNSPEFSPYLFPENPPTQPASIFHTSSQCSSSSNVPIASTRVLQTLETEAEAPAPGIGKVVSTLPVRRTSTATDVARVAAGPGTLVPG